LNGGALGAGKGTEREREREREKAERDRKEGKGREGKGIVNCGRCESVAPPLIFLNLFSFFGYSQTFGFDSLFSLPSKLHLF
jgi:hypothetical protein